MPAEGALELLAFRGAVGSTSATSLPAFNPSIAARLSLSF
jgi:hypothetical protein